MFIEGVLWKRWWENKYGGDEENGGERNLNLKGIIKKWGTRLLKKWRLLKKLKIIIRFLYPSRGKSQQNEGRSSDPDRASRKP